jgi:hypothetical protein
MDIKRATSIEGWMSEEELLWLAEQAKKYEIVVELGSFLGRSTVALADTPGAVLAIDNWKGVEQPQKVDETLFDRFNRNLAPEIEIGKVVPVVADHEFVAVPAAEMVFIDGNHDYENVKRDIANWSFAKLLCGHDYNPQFPGVMRAVAEAFPFKVVPGTTIWYRESL